MADARLSGVENEVITNSAPSDSRACAIDVEVITNGTPDARLCGLALEAIMPATAVFIGWGLPIE